MSTVTASTSSEAPHAAPREQWSGQLGFLFAAIGSAVGLGNIWRFPGVAYSNGGGAFMIPYLVALLCAGVPILLLDYSIGHRFRGSAPAALRRLWKPAETLGWFQVGISFVISVYYAVVLAWALRYMIFSLNLAWGDDPETFFTSTFLQSASGEGASFDFVPGVLAPLLLVWLVSVGILALGVQKGLERANIVFIPLLFAFFIVLVVRALFLPGAAAGLNALFTPEWSALGDPGVWLAAFAQIFFSLSIAFGIMVTYASYLPRRSNLVGTGFTAAFANSSFELLAGIGVFAVLGFMTVQSGTPIADMTITGPGLSFIAFPQIISQMPGGPLVGVLFFASLGMAGLTSLISILQVISAAVQEKFNLGPRTGAVIVGVVAGTISVLFFATTTGLVTLDTVDKFINEIGVVFSAIVLAILVGHVVRKLPMLQRHLNAISAPRIGGWWLVLLKWVVPIALIAMLASTIVALLTEGYEGYASWFLGVFGWGVLGLIIVAAFVLTAIPWRRDVDAEEVFDDDLDEAATTGAATHSDNSEEGSR